MQSEIFRNIETYVAARFTIPDHGKIKIYKTYHRDSNRSQRNVDVKEQIIDKCRCKGADYREMQM